MNCLKQRGRMSPVSTVIMVTLGLLIVMSLVESCSGPANTNTSEGSSGASGTSSSNVTVELSSNQVSAIKVGTVGVFQFTLEKEAIGAISFDEDPALVQAESTLLGAAGTAEVASNELVRARSLYETNG